MTIDYQRVKEKLQFIKSSLNKMKSLKKLNKNEFLSDYRNYDTAKYNLQAAIEAMLDIANHIISREELGKPETNADSFRLLENNNILAADKLNDYVKMAKFRNRIVHLYDEVDEEQIYLILQNNLNDFEDFIKIIINRYLS